MMKVRARTVSDLRETGVERIAARAARLRRALPIVMSPNRVLAGTYADNQEMCCAHNTPAQRPAEAQYETQSKTT
jgi:hypothetical protein